MTTDDTTGKLLLGFSINRNLRSLLSVSNKSNPDHLHCLNGIRAISISWVIVGHVFGNLTYFPNSTNVTYSLKVIKLLSNVAPPAIIWNKPIRIFNGQIK